MTIGRLLYLLYESLDRLLLGRMSTGMQLRVKGTMMASARKLLKNKVPAVSAESLVTQPGTKQCLRRLPEWAEADMADIALHIAPELNPSKYTAARLRQYRAPVQRIAAGRAYSALRARIPDALDMLFIVPWLTRGGADQGVIHYVKACVESGHRVAVLSTEQHASPWRTRLPAGVPFIAAGEVLAGLDEVDGEPTAVLSRLLVQARPKRIHLVNSRLGWDVIKKHGLAICMNTRVFASLFCDERDENGLPSGYAVDYVRDASPHLQAVFTDNSISPATWLAWYGLDKELFKVIRFPAPKPYSSARHEIQHGRRRRLLWASRLDRQKRPDVLLEIARKLPEFAFDVYGSRGPGADRIFQELRRLDNVVLHGPFEELSEIVAEEHLAFVYTSEWDGLPLVLLDAISAGLPVLAPPVGGIVDLVPAMDLVGGADAVDDYVAAIRRLDRHPEAGMDMLARQSLILERHSKKQFVDALRSAPCYID